MRPLFEAPKAHRGELGQTRTHPAILTAARLLRGLASNYERATHPPNMSVQRQQPKVFTSAAEPNYESRTPRPLMAGFWVGS